MKQTFPSFDLSLNFAKDTAKYGDGSVHNISRKQKIFPKSYQQSPTIRWCLWVQRRSLPPPGARTIGLNVNGANWPAGWAVLAAGEYCSYCTDSTNTIVVLVFLPLLLSKIFIVRYQILNTFIWKGGKLAGWLGCPAARVYKRKFCLSVTTFLVQDILLVFLLRSSSPPLTQNFPSPNIFLGGQLRKRPVLSFSKFLPPFPSPFLAVQDSSIGNLVTHSVPHSLSHVLISSTLQCTSELS